MTPSLIRISCLICVLGVAGAVYTSIAPTAGAYAQPKQILEATIDSSFSVAGYIENHRSLPATLEVAGESLTPAGWMQLGVRAILNISGAAGGDSGSAITSAWAMPANPYPTISLDAAAYGTALRRDEYLSLLEGLAATYPDGATLPSTFERNGSAFRFVDAFHMVASILRFYSAYGYLPPYVDPKVASPRGLFPWDTPTGKTAWLSALQNTNGEPYSSTNEYYQTSALDYDMYELVRSIVGQETDAYEAGELIFDWSRARYDSSPYGVNFDVDNLTGFVDDAYEMIRYMQGTSGKPARMNNGLYSSAGLIHGYDRRGYGGTLFTEPTGWYNAEIHASYGAELSANPFFLFETDPPPRGPYAVDLTPESPIFDAVNDVTAKASSTTPLRAFWINASDVQKWGADTIVEAATEGGFNTVVLTVKSFVGRLYFETGSGDNIGWDALGPLVQAAGANGGIDVLAAFNTLTDFEVGKAETWGQRYPNSGGYNEFFMSPCVPAYAEYLRRIIGALYSRYNVDGIILARNYVHSRGWANPECGSVGTLDELERENYIAGFVNDLASHAKFLNRDRKIYLMTAPLLGNGGTSLDQYSDDAAPSRLRISDIDGLILSLHGLAWLTPENEGSPLPSRQAWINYIESYSQASSIPLYTIAHVSKDWMYTPAFYRGLAREYRARGVQGVILTGVNSGEGEFGSAFVEQHFAKLPLIRFGDPPPTPEVVTATEPEASALESFVLHTTHPNPAGERVTISFETSMARTVAIRVYDMLGRTIANVTNDVFGPGHHEVTWTTNSSPAGIYLVIATAGTSRASRVAVVR